MTVNNQFNAEFSSDASTASSRRMIYRHPTDRSLGGVCGGLADFLGWDVVLVRALWVVATFVTSGAGFMVYLLLWLLLPVGTQAAGHLRPAAIQFNHIGGSRVATVLLIVGGLWLLSNLGILPALAGATGGFLRLFFWPLLLIAVGYMLLKGRGNGLRTQFGGMRESVGESVRNANSNVRGASVQMPFRRSRSNRMVLGVCGGLSDKLAIDANLIRLAWVILSLGSMGLGVLVYFALALVVPEEGSHWVSDLESTARANGHNGEFQNVPIAQPVQAVQTERTFAAAAANEVTPVGDDSVQI